MCEFISWIEKDGKNYWLTDKDIREKQWEFIDSVGHEAIEKYFGIEGGEHKETPLVFPPKEIVKDFQNGKMVGMMTAWGKKLEINGKVIRIKNSYGHWEERKYDKAGREVRWQDSDRYWVERKYDKAGREVRYENSKGYWWERKYDEEGRIVKFESGCK